MVGHTGAAYGFYSAMFFEPEKKFCLVVMTNGTTPKFIEEINEFRLIQSEVIRTLYGVFVK